jgi:hypothetical protein
MSFKYVTDSSCNRLAIIIPIDIWNEIITKHEDVKQQFAPAKKPSDYAGTLSKEEGEKFKKHLKKGYNE